MRMSALNCHRLLVEEAVTTSRAQDANCSTLVGIVVNIVNWVSTT